MAKGKGSKASSPKKHPGGRPTKYKPEYVQIVYDACSGYGLDNKGLAKILLTTPQTIATWMKEYPEFFDAVKAGKDLWNTHTVEDSLLKRTMGYKYIETTREPLYNPLTGKPLKDPKTGKDIIAVTKKVTKNVAPDTTAIIFYLKNRDPGRWRDKQEIEHSGNVTVETGIRRPGDDDIASQKDHAAADARRPDRPAIRDNGQNRGAGKPV